MDVNVFVYWRHLGVHLF